MRPDVVEHPGIFGILHFTFYIFSWHTKGKGRVQISEGRGIFPVPCCAVWPYRLFRCELTGSSGGIGCRDVCNGARRQTAQEAKTMFGKLNSKVSFRISQNHYSKWSTHLVLSSVTQKLFPLYTPIIIIIIITITQKTIYSSPVSMAVLSFFFHCSATSFARGSSGLGALNNAWIDSNTVRICRAGDHLSGRRKVQRRHAKREKEDSSKVQFVKQRQILPQRASNRNQAARIMKQIHFFLRPTCLALINQMSQNNKISAADNLWAQISVLSHHDLL